MPTRISRFTVHDDLSAPPGSQPIVRRALSTGGRLPNLIGVLAGAPAALRGYARLRAELRHGTLPGATLERISLAVAQHYGAVAEVAEHRRAAREAGMALDDIALATEWDAYDPRDAALLRYLRPLVVAHARPDDALHEAALEAGCTEEQLLEAMAFAALESFAGMVALAGDVPADATPDRRPEVPDAA